MIDVGYLASSMRISLLAVIITWLFVSPGAESYAENRRRTLDDELVHIAVKLYELELQVPALYMKAFKAGEAGEGLFARLFNDSITVLELAVSRNDKNLLAKFHLARVYFTKSAYGEGKWSKSLLAKAEEQFTRVLSGAAASRALPRQMVAESRRTLEEIKKIRAGQGELVD